MEISIILLTAGVVFLIGLLVFFIIIYNSFIRMQNNIDKSWANIDVLLKQRSDEIPNLVRVVKGYKSYEKETLESITKARAFLIDAQTLSQKAAADSMLSGLVKSLFAVSEKYPDLQASENFIALQKRITGLENELADRREFYNDNVTLYNTRMQSFPDILLAKIIHLKKKELFKASEEDKQYISLKL